MRQAVLEEAFPEAGRGERPDPYFLPVRLPPRGGDPRASVTLDRERATFRRPGRDGDVSLPVTDYRGVAVRMEPAAGDRLLVVLELNHTDPALSVPLLHADDPAEIVADWQAWSRALGLPMLLFEADGSISEPVPHLGRVQVQAPRPRRRRSSFAARRPRFLVRRKTGWNRGVEMVEGAEIIART